MRQHTTAPARAGRLSLTLLAMSAAGQVEPPPFELTDAFLKRQAKLLADLGAGDITKHPGTKGQDSELNWLEMLRGLLPRRYGVASAFVVDSNGGISDQIDIVIFDCHFSPLLFEVGGSIFIPAESVYAAFEVRQSLNAENLEYAGQKLATVRSLHRTTVGVPHAGGHFDAVEPKDIIGGFLCRRSTYNPPFGDSFRGVLRRLAESTKPLEQTRLDVGCALDDGGFALQPSEEGWSVRTSDAGFALIFFVMSLLRKLQSVGSAPAIDYAAYLAGVPGAQ